MYYSIQTTTNGYTVELPDGATLKLTKTDNNTLNTTVKRIDNGETTEKQFSDLSVDLRSFIRMETGLTFE